MIYQEYFFPDKVASSVPASPLAGGASNASGEVKTGNIAMLSAKHGISRARIEAVLRLKMMEKEWEKTNKVCFGSASLFPLSFLSRSNGPVKACALTAVSMMINK